MAHGSVADMTKLLRWMVALAAVNAVGCGVDPGETSNGGSAGTGGAGGSSASGGTGGAPDCPEDPALGPVPPECGIWVSASQGLDANAGTQAASVRTLARAIELAAEGPRRVYACNETWFEVLTVPGNVSLHGGFDCDNGWTYVGTEGKRAMVTPLSPIGMTWIESSPEDEPLMTDFYVEAQDAQEPGGSSIGVFVRDDVTITIRRCEIVAGDGADGADGAPGDAGNEAPEPGAPGTAGGDACSAPISLGGESIEHTCPTGTSKGGTGGDAGPMLAENGQDAEAASGSSYGKGGKGEAFAPACTAGIIGQPGDAGAPGLGGAYGFGKEQLTPEGYLGVSGEDGGLGLPGKGGGGGGASFGSAAVCGAANPGGAAGGSGGSGGCGGKGGRGGQAGGASLGILLRTMTPFPFIDHTYIFTGNGGKGGKGGAPQAGGQSGAGGLGGVGLGSIKPGCPGGGGGAGGQGGWGGGGLGGSTICIMYPMGPGVPGMAPGGCVPGEAGLGGIGDPTVGDSKGEPGIRTDVKGVPL